MKATGKNFRALASVTVFAFALLFLVTGCKKKTAVVDNSEPEALFAVNTYITKAGNLDNYLEFGGDVDAVSFVAVVPDTGVSGKILQKLVNVGDKVSRNQVIAYIDPSVPGMNYARSPVRAPIAGRVTSFIPTVGTMVNQSTIIAQIADTDELEIKVSVAERFISRIALGQTAIATFDAYPGVEFSATVVEVSPVLDTASRTMNIKLRFTKPDARIRAGMYARVRLVTESVKNAIVVPSNAIVTRDSKKYLFVIASQQIGNTSAKVRLAPITIGISVDNMTEIMDGISVGDEIVIKGQNLLDEGASVNIISVKED